MKILVTGASGFVGQHLLSELSSQEVVGTTHRVGVQSLRSRFPHVQFFGLDVTDAQAVEQLVARVKPEVCFHLAGIASVDQFAAHVRESFQVNLDGWHNVLEAFRGHAPQAVLVYISSCQVYGSVDADRMPITEETPGQPGNFYSVAKLSGEWLARLYAKSFGMQIRTLRPFNHIGPGQTISFVCSSLARQVARIEAGLAQPVISAGNLTNCRDFTDVRDIVKAYVLAPNRCQNQEVYNVCSGQPVAIQDVLEHLLGLAGLKGKVRVQSKHQRQGDPELIVGSYAKFHQATGWKPHIPMEVTLRDTLRYWQEQIRSSHAPI